MKPVSTRRKEKTTLKGFDFSNPGPDSYRETRGGANQQQPGLWFETEALRY